VESVLTEIFHNKYKNNLWNSEESVSGEGSELENTKHLRQKLQQLLQKYDVRSILDAPCGDLNWMKEIDLSNIKYIGADIVPDLIKRNKEKFNFDFRIIDVTKDELPKVDLIINRDCLVHLSNENIGKFISNVKESGSKYLLTTSFIPGENSDIPNGDWRPINLEIEPFNLTNPIDIINENCKESSQSYTDKCMSLYDLKNF